MLRRPDAISPTVRDVIRLKPAPSCGRILIEVNLDSPRNDRPAKPDHRNVDSNGQARGFIATPVPEPATLALLSAPLPGLGAAYRRPRRRNASESFVATRPRKSPPDRSRFGSMCALGVGHEAIRGQDGFINTEGPALVHILSLPLLGRVGAQIGGRWRFPCRPAYH
jgi:hypothetical protein